MSDFVAKLVHDDFVWSALNNALPGKRKRSGQNTNINCPMCVARGETADRRMRCGIRRNGSEIIVHCFNCGFASRFRPGMMIGKNLREFLSALGMAETEIKRLNHKALQVRNMLDNSPDAATLVPTTFRPQFEARALPKGALPFSHWTALDVADIPADFLDVMAYLYGRGEDVAEATDYYWTPDQTNNYHRRVIVPFLHNDTIVGYTGRAVDAGCEPRYHTETPNNFLFNNQFMVGNRKYVVLVEGIFDALAIEGIGAQGAKLNDSQASWLNSCGKQIVVVPDRDDTGQRLIDVALRHGWMVAFPRSARERFWEDDVKDAAEAVRRYGRLYTLRSIIESATENKIKINMYRKLAS